MGSDPEPPTLQVAGTLWGLIKTPLSGVRPPRHGTPVLWPALPHRCNDRMTVWSSYQVKSLTPAPHRLMQEAPPCQGRGRAPGTAPTLPHLLNFLTTPCETFDFTQAPPPATSTPATPLQPALQQQVAVAPSGLRTTQPG